MIEKSFEPQTPADIESKEKKLNFKSKEFFYSESLDAYVATHPLSVDDRVAKAASELGIELDWDDEGRINNITYSDSKLLAEKLGAVMLSPLDYWKVYNDALERKDVSIVEQLRSDQNTEWLDVVFEKDNEGNVFMIEHPSVVKTPEGIKYIGEKKKISIPRDRPGWFNPRDNIDPKTGFPLRVNPKLEKKSNADDHDDWKYWSVFKTGETVAAIRGFVTSSGTPSFDCDMPPEAKQSVLMLRECRKELLEPAINPELMETAGGFIEKYTATSVAKAAAKNPQEHEAFYSGQESFFDLLKESGRELIDSNDKEAQKINEKFIDMLGIIRVMAKTKGDRAVMEKVDNLAQDLFGVKKEEVSFLSFSSFVRDSREKLKSALMEKKKIVFVMGHKNPDTDTAVSCLAEAYRNSLLDKDTIYIPVIQGSRIPDEIRELLGDEISDSLPATDKPDYDAALKSGQARWILVDQNVSDVQRFAVSIIDHHVLSDKTKKQDVSKTWEMAGSTTALVVQKFHGMGIDVDRDLARVLYGATLMDTENRSNKKMTYKDGLVMDDLKKISQIKDDREFYQNLMGRLLNTNDAESLFARDYKQDWGLFGFAVAKVKGAFNKEGGEIKKDLLDRLVDLAKKNNIGKNFPLTIVKVADYLEDNETINQERAYLIFNQRVLPEFKATMFEFITKIIRNEFKDNNLQIDQRENFIDFRGANAQLSRKAIAPLLEPVVEAFNEYYYSPATDLDLYVKREFLKINGQIQQTAHELGIELSIDREGRINNITYNEARQLLDSLGLVIMSLPEYWNTLKEAEITHDEQMLKHLRSSGFVEFLDTVILDGKYIINHPKVIKKDTGYEYEGEKREIAIPEGVPGLVNPKEINPETGFPTIVHNPNQYGDKKLWRYWSPDAPVCIPTRGHVFLLGQPSFDTKIHPADALPNLGIRPCCRTVNPPIVEITESEKGPTVKITKRV